ncbi:MAG TPA: tripartite tricarboxylate transporter substrate binding protein [Ramlibacter sp.]|nr:tripartite tricarboxylate transporter substrate binding protein [Ramlibacter sp.]
MRAGGLSRRAALAALASTTLAGGSVRAQSWPERPLRLVVPFGPGSGADIVARVYGERLAAALGQPVVVDNKPGASGIIGAEFVARAPADGYTLLLASQSVQASNPGMFKRLPYDPAKSFDPVSLLGSFPLILVTHPSLPVGSVRELVAWSRANPGRLTFAYGTGAAQVTAELFRKLAGAEVLLVPYKSNPLALQAVVAGESNVMVIDPGPGLPLIQAGRVKAHAVTTSTRSALVPQLPTMSEAGMPGYELFGWNALVVPAGTPAAIVERLHKEVGGIAAQPDVRQKLGAAGVDAQAGTPAELRRFMEAELAKWTGHIRAAGIVPE